MKFTRRQLDLLDMLLIDRINDKLFISKQLKGLTLKRGYKYESIVAELYKQNIEMLQLAIDTREKLCK